MEITPSSRLIFAAVERLFTLVLIAPLQVCSLLSLLMKTVLIAPLQSPWSSVTQGPFYISGYYRLWALACALFNCATSSHSLQRVPLILRLLLHSLTQNHPFFIQHLPCLSFHSFPSLWPRLRTPHPFPPSLLSPARIIASGLMI